MKIGIDISQTAFRGSGVDRYTRTLIDALLTYDKKSEYIFFYTSMRVPLDPIIRKQIQPPHLLKEFRFPPTFISFLWNGLHVAPIERFVENVDVFVTSDWVEPPATHAIKVTTLHDMAAYRFPQAAHPRTGFDVARMAILPNIVAQQKRRHHWVTRESKGIFADSTFTKNEAIALLKLPQDRLYVLYPAVEIVAKACPWDQVKEKYKIMRSYILTVGKREPRKNIEVLAKAFLAAGLKNTELFVVGDKGWDVEEDHRTQGIQFLGYVPDEELAALYSHALCFVYPSLYEGFGYPVIESMGYGCPVATSDTSSLAEVAAGAALLFDPTDASSITQSLKSLATDAALRKELVKKGFERFHNFSKKQFADNFVRIVSEIYHDNRH